MTLERFDPSRVPLILVVEDDADAREIYASTLRMYGFRVEVAENGAIAYERALQLGPDVILLDHAMPVMDGLETARRLRANARTNDTPILMLTGFDEGSAQGRALRAGASCDAYLVKPCDVDEMVAALRAALRQAPLHAWADAVWAMQPSTCHDHITRPVEASSPPDPSSHTHRRR
jgi:DNA-binding response OmpR family regulator